MTTTTLKSIHRSLASLKLATKVPALLTQAQNIVQAMTNIVRTRKAAPSGFKNVIVCARQWTGSKANPLDPKAVLAEIRSILGAYGIKV